MKAVAYRRFNTASYYRSAHGTRYPNAASRKIRLERLLNGALATAMVFGLVSAIAFLLTL